MDSFQISSKTLKSLTYLSLIYSLFKEILMLIILANTNQLRTTQPWKLGNFLDSLLNFLEIYQY